MPDAPQIRRRRRWLLIPIGAAAALALGMTGWWYQTAGPGAYTTVPDGLLGGTIADAEANLGDAGLTVITAQEFHPTKPAGEVLTVSPAEATDIRKEGAVTLVVSRGPDLRTVTVDSVGMPLRDVEDAFADAGFSVPTALHVYSDTAPAGTVISATVDGAAVTTGAKFPVGTVVVLTCSDGLAPVTIPNVVGLTRDQGVAALGALGLNFTEEVAYHATIPAGVIKAQSPGADTVGHRFDTVHLVVSKGPEPAPPKPEPPAGTVKVPSLVGMYKYPAWEKIYNLGFEGSHIDDNCTLGYDHCVVASQSPAAGTYKPPGTKITIYLRDE